ncbi:bacteriophage terminase small subunit [Sphingobacterium corticibacter]|nr:bacteriophage terminase small subunit [Sphingobacterium corticibacter]
MFLLQIEGWARDGYDDRQIAELLDLSAEHFSRLKSANPQLYQALKKGRQPLEVLVENSLFKRATGLKVKTTVRKWVVMPNEDGEYQNVEVVQETETELPPDTGAAMAWLKHKKPEMWNIATKMQMEQDINMNGSISIDSWLDANNQGEDSDDTEIEEDFDGE